MIRAKIIAVTKTASLTGPCDRLINIYSAKNAAIQEIATTANERQPKKYIELTIHGKVAIMTRRIMGCFMNILDPAIVNHI